MVSGLLHYTLRHKDVCCIETSRIYVSGELLCPATVLGERASGIDWTDPESLWTLARRENSKSGRPPFTSLAALT